MPNIFYKRLLLWASLTFFYDRICSVETKNVTLQFKILIVIVMAKPIAPTPVLKGQAAVDFVSELLQNKKASATEKARVKAGADRIQAMLTFSM